MSTFTLITVFEKWFYLSTLAGLLIYLSKKYVRFNGWHLPTFVRTEAGKVLSSIGMTIVMAVFVPDLLELAANDPSMTDFVAKHERLMQKATLVFGLLLGVSGGTLGYDVLEQLYSVPFVGPFVKSVVARLKKSSADDGQ